MRVKNKSLKSGAILRKTSKILNICFILFILILVYLPMLMIVIFSFTEGRSIGDWKNYKFTFELFAKLFNSKEIMRSLGNSLIIGIVAAILATLIGTFSAIGLFYSRKKVRTVLDYSGQITMFNADIITALSMLVFFAFLSMGNDYLRLIIAHTIICLPYVVMSIMPRLSQLNPNVYEAGLDLGASPVRTLFTVILPQLMGGMMAGFALAFTISMDDFTITAFVSDLDTIPTFLYNALKNKSIKEEIRALSTVLMGVIMLVLIAINIISAKRKKPQQLSVNK